MATKRPSALTESDDQREERDARIAEVMERVRHHQQQAACYLDRAERAKTDGDPPPVKRKARKTTTRAAR